MHISKAEHKTFWHMQSHGASQTGRLCASTGQSASQTAAAEHIYCPCELS